MKKIFIILSLLFAAIVANAKWVPFINKNGVYKPFNEKTDVVPIFVQTDDCPKGSFNYYRSCLGYMDGEVISYYNDDCIFVALNVFNNDVIFVIPADTTKTTLTQSEVDSYLSSYIPSKSAFVNKLKEGVEKKSIRQTFVEKTLNVTSTDNKIKDEVHGFTYIFANGFLVSYETNNGLNNDAIYVQEKFPSIFNKIQSIALNFYGSSDNNVAKYINGQCYYFMRINMKYLRMASNPSINYNYVLLYCIFEPGIYLDDFTFLVPEASLGRVNQQVQEVVKIMNNV